jgi:hypothetical protein
MRTATGYYATSLDGMTAVETGVKGGETGEDEKRKKGAER